MRLRVMGLISGTSMDGIDAAIVEIEAGTGTGDLAVTLLAFETTPYPSDVRVALAAVMAADGPARPAVATLRDVCALHFSLGESFAAAATALAAKTAGAVDLIGSHGQTVYHLPDDDGAPGFARSTLQLGEPALIAARTGITCVADFRVADIAAGGQGAPLVPYADFLLLRDAAEDRAALNIGGIANLTLLPAGCAPNDVLAFDIGPGNSLIDLAVAHFTDGRQRYDEAGAIAARAEVNDELFDWLAAHPYFARRPPKTTGRETFGSAYFREVLGAARGFGASGEQAISTLTASTAHAIAQAVPATVRRIVASGGGVHNDALMANLRAALANRFSAPPALSRSDDYGMPADAKEAMAFALLAHQTLLGQTGNLPSATGALRPVVLGKIVPGDNYRTLATRISILLQ